MKKKRLLRKDNFLRHTSNLLASSPRLARGLLYKKIDTTMREKILLSVIAVNDCDICSWIHTSIALQEGVPEHEIKQIMEGAIGKVDNDYHLNALAYAQAFANTDGITEESLTLALSEYYSNDIAREILAFIHAVNFMNLSLNTFEHNKQLLSEDSFFKRGNEFGILFTVVFSPVYLIMSSWASVAKKSTAKETDVSID